MPILSDGDIRRRLRAGDLQIDPIDDTQVQPASVDFALGPSVLILDGDHPDGIDPYDVPGDLYTHRPITESDPLVLRRGDFVLGTTLERIALPADLVARCEGKSSLGRLGLLIHITAGFVDAGWPLGHITLELSNVSRVPLRLTPGMKIGQFSFEALLSPAERPYGHPDLNSKYVGQVGATGSRYTGNPRPTLAPPPAGRFPAPRPADLADATP